MRQIVHYSFKFSDNHPKASSSPIPVMADVAATRHFRPSQILHQFNIKDTKSLFILNIQQSIKINCPRCNGSPPEAEQTQYLRISKACSISGADRQPATSDLLASSSTEVPFMSYFFVDELLERTSKTKQKQKKRAVIALRVQLPEAARQILH